MDLEAIRRAKRAAANAALEAYSTTLVRELERLGIPLEEALRESHHVHEAVLVDPQTHAAVRVTAAWVFGDESRAFAEALAGAERCAAARGSA